MKRVKTKKQSKNEWIGKKISELVRENYPQDQAVATAISMYDQQFQSGGRFGKNVQTLGNSNLSTLEKQADSNFGKNMAKLGESNLDIFSQNPYKRQEVLQLQNFLTPADSTYGTPQEQLQNFTRQYQNLPNEQRTGLMDIPDQYSKMPDSIADYEARLLKTPSIYEQKLKDYLQPRQYQIGGVYDKQYMAMTPQQEQLKSVQFDGDRFRIPQGIDYKFNPQMQAPQASMPYADYAQKLAQNNPIEMQGYGQYNLDPNFKPSDAIAPQSKNPLAAGSGYQTDAQGNAMNNKKFEFFNPYIGRDPQTSAYGLGESIQNKDGLGIAGNAIHLLSNLGRNAFAGAGNAKREQHVMQDAMEKYREGLKPAPQSMQEGGYAFDTKPIVRYQPGVTNDRMGDGFYLYSKNPTDQGFDVNRDREFVKQSEMMTVQRTPQWKKYMTNQAAMKQQPTRQLASFQDGGMMAGQQMPPQEEQQGGQEQKLIMQVAEAIQGGADPNQILQQLVEMGIPEDQATQLIQSITQQMQGGQEQAPQQEEMYEMGGIKKKSLPKLLTGEYTVEKNDVEEEDIVAEVEGKEYIKTPEGEITQVLGKSHAQGGVQLTEEQLPENSEILSDHLTLNKELATIFKEIGVTTKDTYAKALDKWTAKSGLKKIVEEQEEVINKLEAQSELLVKRPISKDTIKLNTALLQDEIYELEKKREPLLKEKQAIFDQLFAAQEASKSQEKQEGMMQEGGTFNNDLIVKYAKKHGISPERANELVNEYKNGGVAKYQDGTKVGVSPLINKYSKNIREGQHATEKAYGVVDPTIALTELYNNFPDIIDSEAVFKNYITVDDKGQPKFKSNLKLNEVSTIIGNMQRLVDERMRDSANVIISNPSNFSEEAVKEAQRYLKDETFMSNLSGTVSDADSIRGYDSKLGNFTSGRYSMKMNLVTPEDQKLLDSNGIRTIRQLKNSPLRDKLSKTSLDNIKNIEGLVGDSYADYAIEEVPISNKIADTPIPTDTTNKFANLNNAQKARTGLMALPNQYAQLPDALQGALKLEYRPNLMENQNITADPIVAEIRRSEQNAMQSIQNLPDEQRAAAAAQIQANTQEQFNKTMGQVQAQNLQSNSAVANQNAQILNNSQDINNRYLMDYENKIYRAQAITDADRRNYFLHNQKVDLENFNAVNKANLYNQLADNYQLTDRGLELYNSPQLSYDGISADQANQNILRNAAKIKIEEKKAAKKAVGKNGGRFKKRT